MKKTISLLLALFLLLALCACGGEAPREDAAEQKSVAYSRSEADAAMPEEALAYESPAEMNAVYGLSPTAAPTAAGSAAQAPAQRPDKIIYSANVQVETVAFDESLGKLDQLVEEYGGWIQSSSLNGSNYADSSRGRVSRRSASYTLRIPSERFQDLMGSLTELGNVPYSYVYTENVTAQYYDVQARLTAYTTQEQRLLEMMEIAESVEDVILLEDRLTEVRYQIESLQSSLNNWDRQVSFSTVYVDISEVQEYTPEPQVQPSFGQQLLTALEDGLRSAGDFCRNMLLGLVTALPLLIALILIAVIVILIVKKRRKARRAAKAQAAAPAIDTPPADGREDDRKEN